MKIHLVVTGLPPRIDGVGDYTAKLAEELAGAGGVQVTILTTRGFDPDPVPGVAVRQVFGTDPRRGVHDLVPAIAADRPDWVVLQYSPFAFGRWGLNPFLAGVVRGIGPASPGTRVAVMMHETYVNPENWKFAVMQFWQRRTFRSLGRAADLVFFSIDPWARRYREWFPGKPVLHLPVGSGVPRVAIAREEARGKLGIAAGVKVLGLFGTAHPSRMFGLIARAGAAARAAGHEASVLYVGPHGAAVRGAMGDLPVIDAGRQSPEEVSRHLAAADLYLMPFLDGVSTRRTSMMAGLQHGLATVGTLGPLTDEVLREQNGKAMLLSPTGEPEQFVANVLKLLDDEPLRRRIGEAGERFYNENLAWPHIAGKLLRSLAAAGPAGSAGDGLSKNQSAILA